MGVEKKKRYKVVGGQYVSVVYGYYDTLHGAKIVATKNQEYWDNWQGWHIPRVEDTYTGIVYSKDGKKWEDDVYM